MSEPPRLADTAPCYKELWLVAQSLMLLFCMALLEFVAGGDQPAGFDPPVCRAVVGQNATACQQDLQAIALPSWQHFVVLKACRLGLDGLGPALAGSAIA